jgi:outer membrane protein TolC
VNPVIAQANANLLHAIGVTGEYRSTLGPVFAASAGTIGYSQGINEVRDNHVVETATHLQPTVGALVSLPIDITGYLRAATDAAHFEEIAARLDVNRTRNEVVAGVETAYYNVLRSQALENVARENLLNAQARLDDANKKFQAQTVAILDVARAQTDVAEAQQQLIVARNAVSLNIAALNNAIGLDVSTSLKVTDADVVEQPPGVTPPSVPPVTPTSVPLSGTPGQTPAQDAAALQADLDAATAVAAQANLTSKLSQATPMATPSPTQDSLQLGSDFDALVKEALAQRPEILQSEADIAAAHKGIYYARRSTLPQLSVNLRYEYAASTFGTSVVLNNSQAFVGLTIPLYDAGTAHARVQQAVGQEANALIVRRRLTDAVTLEVRQAYLDLGQARDRVAVANQALAQAREAFLLARIRYNAGVTAKAGVSPLLEVSDAQAALTLAETRQVEGLYDYNSARVGLNRAIGRYSYANDQIGYPKAPPIRP